MRPDWCPPDVWEVAVKLQDELYYWTDEEEAQTQDTLSFARAILAERERCAAVADELHALEFADEAYAEGFFDACNMIATAIRGAT